MHTLAIYDSQHGNTERIAQVIAETLAARAARVAETPSDFDGITLLVLGCPTHSWKPTPAMQRFLDGLTAQQVRGLAVACFDTRYKGSPWLTGSAAKVIHRRLRALGVSTLAPPESFFVQGVQGPLYDGELDRAVAWARTLRAQVEAAAQR